MTNDPKNVVGKLYEAFHVWRLADELSFNRAVMRTR